MKPIISTRLAFITMLILFVILTIGAVSAQPFVHGDTIYAKSKEVFTKTIVFTEVAGAKIRIKSSWSVLISPRKDVTKVQKIRYYRLENDEIIWTFVEMQPAEIKAFQNVCSARF